MVRKNTKKTKQEENKKIQQKIKNWKIQVSNWISQMYFERF